MELFERSARCDRRRDTSAGVMKIICWLDEWRKKTVPGGKPKVRSGVPGEGTQ